MMNYHRNRDKKKAYIYLPIIIIAVLLILVFTPIMRWSFDGLESVFISGADNGRETVGIISSIFLANKKLDKLDELIIENDKLKLQILKFEDKKKELEELQKIYNLTSSQEKLEVARIIMRPPASGFDILVLEKVSNSTSAIGDIVLSSGVALGEIIEVLDKTIRVKLFSAYGNKLLGFVKPHNLEQEIFGNGSGNFRLGIPREIEIAKGDRIYLASNPDYLLAIVEEVIFDARDPFKTVLAVVPVNVQHLGFVEILSN